MPLLLAAPADPKDKQPPEPEPKSEQPTSSTLPAEPIPPAKITPEVAAHKSPPAEAVFPAHQRPVDQPRLTDLLPDTPSGKTSAAEPLPANPLRDSDMVAPAETLAVDAATRFNLGGQQVSLQQMAAYCSTTAGKSLTIHYRLSDSTVSLVSVLAR